VKIADRYSVIRNLERLALDHEYRELAAARPGRVPARSGRGAEQPVRCARRTRPPRGRVDRDHRGRRTLAGTVRRERRLSGEPRRVVDVTWDSAHWATSMRPFSADRESIALYRALLPLDPVRYRASLDQVVTNFALDLRDLAYSEQEIADKLARLSLPDAD
jgi:hypothetical protein